MNEGRNSSAFQSTVHFLSSSTLLANGSDRKRSVVEICGFMAEL